MSAAEGLRAKDWNGFTPDPVEPEVTDHAGLGRAVTQLALGVMIIAVVAGFALGVVLVLVVRA